MKVISSVMALVLLAAITLALSSSSSLFVNAQNKITAYGYYSAASDSFTFTTTPKKDGSSWACELNLTESRQQTGWDQLVLTANNDLLKSNATQAYRCLGNIEGQYTAKSIIQNNFSSQGTLDGPTYDWIQENIEWMDSVSTDSDPKVSNTTTAQGLLRFMAYARGMCDGINAGKAQDDLTWTVHDVISLMAQAELSDIQTAAHLQKKTTTTSAAPTPSTSVAPPPTTTTSGTTVAPPTTSSTAAPTTSTGAPTTSTAAPTTSTAAPTTSTAAPTTSTGAPTTSTGAPTTSTGAPTTSTAAPTTSTAAPTTSTAAPTTSTAAPTTSTAAPTTSTAAPTTSTAAPTTSTAAPTTSTAAPTTSTAAPTTSTAPATTSTAAPTTSTAAPTSSTAAPTTSTAAPTTSTGAPTTSAAMMMNQRDAVAQNDDDSLPPVRGQFSRSLPDRGFGSHCSASVVRTADDLVYSHDTWSSYSTMIRTLKTLNVETTVTYSSYPGQISLDDFLFTGNNVGIQETTNDFNNNDLFRKYVVPQTALTFMRTIIASIWAGDAKEWCQIFLDHNSGSYNNQFMVIDFKKVNKQNLESGKPLPSETFYVLEQAPGPNSVWEDQTNVLNTKGFWKSFNLAYYQQIRDLNGDQKNCDDIGNYYCYDKYSRSLIFERNYTEGLKNKNFNYNDVVALQDYNGAPYDAASSVDTATKPGQPCDGCDPMYSYKLAIAARADLEPQPGNVTYGNLSQDLRGAVYNNFPFGAIDVKMTSFKLISREVAATADGATASAGISAKIHARSGPSTSGGQLPVFDWSSYKAPASVPEFYLRHEGQPKKFDFAPIVENVQLDNHAVSPWPHGNGGKPEEKKGLTAGEKAAIGICVSVFALVVGFFVYKKHQASKEGTGSRYASELETGRGEAGTYQTIR